MKSSINVRYNVYAPKAERNRATHLNRATHWPFIRSDQSSNCRAALTHSHVSIKQRCEIQCEALEFSEEHKRLCGSLKFKAKQEKHCVQPDSQKAFQSTHCHHLPWIYCSNTHCTMVLWHKCGISTLNFITGVMVYNYYSMYLWLSYSMCAFILNVFRLLFFIQIGYLKTI